MRCRICIGRARSSSSSSNALRALAASAKSARSVFFFSGSRLTRTLGALSRMASTTCKLTPSAVASPTNASRTSSSCSSQSKSAIPARSAVCALSMRSARWRFSAPTIPFFAASRSASLLSSGASHGLASEPRFVRNGITPELMYSASSRPSSRRASWAASPGSSASRPEAYCTCCLNKRSFACTLSAVLEVLALSALVSSSSTCSIRLLYVLSSPSPAIASAIATAAAERSGASKI